ncbi:hypothetical protein [Desulfosporosinus sp. BG]|uniref:hypothetical protein n=1 Tax=Desulfosporosinus sp. BG TaxID=1633135 RepID=UPI00114CC61F|nr:hypothetical protein [Desulfosporosinus sp. BG]
MQRNFLWAWGSTGVGTTRVGTTGVSTTRVGTTGVGTTGVGTTRADTTGDVVVVCVFDAKALGGMKEPCPVVHSVLCYFIVKIQRGRGDGSWLHLELV